MDPSPPHARTGSDDLPALSGSLHQSRPIHDEPDPKVVDSLADLFLGEGPLAPVGPREPRSTSLLHGEPESGLGDELLSPDADKAPPLRLVRPEAEHGAHLPSAGDESPSLCASIDDLDAEVMCGSWAEPDACAQGLDGATGTTPTIEAVVLGHLPVIAPAWAAQHAQRRATELGMPVGLARFRASNVTIDIVADRPPAGHGGAPDPRPHSWHDAMRSTSERASHWIVVVDGPDEALLAESSDLDAITVLTGADRAAVVACYQTLKTLDGQMRAAIGDDECMPRLGIGVMGAPGHRSEAAASKLVESCERFLGQPMMPPVLLPRMEQVSARAVFHGPCDAPVSVFIAALRDALDDPPLGEPAGPALDVRTEALVPPAAIPSSDWRDDEVVFTDQWDDEPPSAIKPASNEPTGHTHQTPIDRLRAASIIAGLTDVGLDCPVAPHVGLATDADGVLHLAAIDGDRADTAADLLRARHWARSHEAILKRADPTLQPPIEPIAHLITRRADRVRSLIDTDIRVHVMAPASAAIQGWVVSTISE